MQGINQSAGRKTPHAGHEVAAATLAPRVFTISPPYFAGQLAFLMCVRMGHALHAGRHSGRQRHVFLECFAASRKCVVKAMVWGWLARLFDGDKHTRTRQAAYQLRFATSLMIIFLISMRDRGVHYAKPLEKHRSRQYVVVLIFDIEPMLGASQRMQCYRSDAGWRFARLQERRRLPSPRITLALGRRDAVASALYARFSANFITIRFRTVSLLGLHT